MFVVNPVDNTTYFYAEGMNAPMSGYNNRGHQARAAIVVDRSLREVAPGVYGSTVKLPAAGKFDVASCSTSRKSFIASVPKWP